MLKIRKVLVGFISGVLMLSLLSVNAFVAICFDNTFKTIGGDSVRCQAYCFSGSYPSFNSYVQMKMGATANMSYYSSVVNGNSYSGGSGQSYSHNHYSVGEGSLALTYSASNNTGSFTTNQSAYFRA